MTDPITDMFNRILNAQAVKKDTAAIPFSKIKYEIARILEREGFVKRVEKKGKGTNRLFNITLKYGQEGEPAILGLKRISKPGQRIYSSSRDIKRVRGGYGIAIISTPNGLMTDRQAKKEKVGGEIICQVW